MNKKVTFTELIDLLSLKNSCSKRDAEAFLRELISITTDTLSKGDSLRINGLGVFKSQWVEDRASVNVRTGEPYLIPGHYKLTFTPAKAVREVINEPFACFCVEELPDDAPILSATLEEEAEVAEETDTEVSEEAQPTVGDAQPTIEEVHPTAEAEQPAIEENEPAVEVEEPVMAEEEPLAAEQQSVVEEEQLVEDELPASDEEQPAASKPQRRWWIAIAAVIVLGVVGLCSFYLYRNYTSVDKVVDKSALIACEVQELMQDDDRPVLQPLAVDTLAVDTLLNHTPAPVAPVVVTDTIRRNVFLTTLSLRHYGHKAFWVYIYDANKHIIANPDNVEVGTVIVIPPREKYGIDAADTLSVNKALDIAQELKQQRSQVIVQK